MAVKVNVKLTLNEGSNNITCHANVYDNGIVYPNLVPPLFALGYRHKWVTITATDRSA